MPAPSVLIQSIVRAVVKHGDDPSTFLIDAVLADAWRFWEQATDGEQRRADVEAVVALSAADVARVVAAEAAGMPEARRGQVAAYVGQALELLRRRLRRPDDPRGATVPGTMSFRAANDLAPFLPPRLPRFRPGDRPLPGVDWELTDLLGVGGFGEVWKARNPHFDGVAPVALKFCLDPEAKERLLRHEAAVLNRVMREGKHDGIVPLLHTYLGAEPPCLAYEYIDGGDLADLIQEAGAAGGLAPPEAAKIVARLAEIVGFAHRLSPPIVHRDLKPANILVQNLPGRRLFQITDFGIGGLAVTQARDQSRRGASPGEYLTTAVRGSYTPLYASPQQMAGEAPDPRDDVFALGVIWHQLLTGNLTKGRPGGEAWKKRLLDRGMTADLLALLTASFEEERQDRPADAGVLAAKLAPLLSGKARAAPPAKVPASPPPPLPPPAAEQSGAGRGAIAVAENKGSRAKPAGFPLWRTLLILVGVLVVVFALVSYLIVWLVPPLEPDLPKEIGNSVGMKLRLIPAGRFQMGAENETPIHDVAITRPFYLGVHEVTLKEYQMVLGEKHPSLREGAGGAGPNFPVDSVAYGDAVEFCTKLSDRPEEKSARRAYRLPTEAEWEYACRAGTRTDYPFGDSPKVLDQYAWYDKNSGGRTHEVGGKAPNPWGLYDMEGNVWEWCSDWYDQDYYKSSPGKDPQGPLSGSVRVIRGGAFSWSDQTCRSAARAKVAPDHRIVTVGFRAACTVNR